MLGTKTAVENASDGLEAARAHLLALFVETRTRTESLTAGLSAEDQQLQSMPDASPTKWHRGHTTWFFETFVVAAAGGELVDGRYAELFNSYYEALGSKQPRARRGMLSRPTSAEIGQYRRSVEERVLRFVGQADASLLARLLPALELGIAHEEQHQELILTDILHAFSENPLRPAYRQGAGVALVPPGDDAPARFVRFDGGPREIGATGSGAFSLDNERPRHKVWLEPFALADRPVTVAELLAFVREGGYRTPSLWLSDGLDFVREHGLTAPLYSRVADGALHVFTLAGERVASPAEPASHLSYYEADALARFLGGRLPTEAEWEHAAAQAPIDGHFLDDGRLHPTPASAGAGAHRVRQLFGDVWEWTRSSHEPYPGYVAPAGALGEYNGKFMASQYVLRGGSCLTPRRHMRATYRNFWRPATRFQMTGLRLAREVEA
jgi:ergothioneine biosynthesis protein EgtB